MAKKFGIHIFYPDGEPPESGEQDASELSDKWLNVCADLLELHGPVMEENMGSTLSHFDIKMGGPVGLLMAHKKVCYQFAISLGQGSKQDREATLQFRQLVQNAAEATGKYITEVGHDILISSPNVPSLLVFDTCSPDVEVKQKEALLQLGFHLVGAYFNYMAAQPAQA